MNFVEYGIHLLVGVLAHLLDGLFQSSIFLLDRLHLFQKYMNGIFVNVVLDDHALVGQVSYDN
jgi:hypothetical protein